VGLAGSQISIAIATANVVVFFIVAFRGLGGTNALFAVAAAVGDFTIIAVGTAAAGSVRERF
jgi:hypothetical protein